MTQELVKADFLPAFAKGWSDDEGHHYEVKSDRVIRDGHETAVLLSPGFGGGFVTWSEGVSPFEPLLVIPVLLGRKDWIVNADKEKLAEEIGAEYITNGGGAEDLKIVWVPNGYSFGITDYDGNEYLLYPTDLPYRA
jgi:hypothetical protein